jgi:flagellar biosynthesis/type III secretory pathway M-ring protein FliF/YscJ
MVNAAEDSVQELIQEGVTWVDSAYQLDPTIAIDTVSFRDTMNSINAGADIVDLETLEGMAAMNLMLKVMLILVAGIIIWRVIIIMNKKNSKPKGGKYFQRKYSDKWKNR